MAQATHQVLISDRRPTAVGERTRLGLIVGGLDSVAVAYRLRMDAGGGRELAGWGRLRVESNAGWLWCRVVGEVFRPSPVEYGFHSFWLTRRGMILVVANLLEDRAPPARPPQEIFIQPVQPFDRILKAEAARWLRRRIGPEKGSASL